MNMTGLETLVSLLIAPHQPPYTSSWNRTAQDRDFDSPFVHVQWMKNNHIITLEACAHRVWLTSYVLNWTDCCPERLFIYTHTRLTMLLEWMNGELPVADLDALLSNAIFHQTFDTDPIITKHMSGGNVTELLLRTAVKLRYKRDVK